jgi:ribosomal protein S18 acetylase RimI-like enzyme
MSDTDEPALRPTRTEDLDFVMALERDPENSPFVGQWSRTEHEDAIARADREHWILERPADRARLGFAITYDLRAAGHGVYLKRIVVAEKSRGVGRRAVGRIAERAFREQGAAHLWLRVRPENARAQRTYAALGFATIPVDDALRRELGAATGDMSERSLVMVLARPGG